MLYLALPAMSHTPLYYYLYLAVIIVFMGSHFKTKTARTTGLTRPIQPMPDFVREALVKTGSMDAYNIRPPYQRNDYLSWINRAKKEDTKKDASTRCPMNFPKAIGIWT